MGSVQGLGVLAKHAYWNLKYVYERFSALDNAYKKTAYHNHINGLYSVMYVNVDILAEKNPHRQACAQTNKQVNGQASKQPMCEY